MKWIWGVMVLVVVATGCKTQQAKSEPGLRALGKPVTAEKSPSDETLGAEIRRRLDLVGRTETAGIIVEVDGGVVTLRGTAASPLAAMRAVAAAQAVPGVKLVRNEMLTGGPVSLPRY
jgi:osmotically-inducible protein OsmY